MQTSNAQNDGRLPLEYVLPLRWRDDSALPELTDYLRRLANEVDVTVVDGSAPELFERHDEQWQGLVRHLSPSQWPGRNGKVAGVVTGVYAARHEHVVIADDDVRYEHAALVTVSRQLETADLVRPQNYFDPLPWHARWDTGRTLLNRALGSDYPGTYGLRQSTFIAMGGYDGDVLFENLELSRTVRAAGGREVKDSSIFVARRPPTASHFLGQRVRQAYDDLAQPARLAAEASVVPVAVLLSRQVVRPGSSSRLSARVLMAAPLVVVGVAEFGRRKSGGRRVFPPTSALWAPAWLAERAVCVWLALAYRLAGGVPYAGQRLPTAAHSVRLLRGRLAHGTQGVHAED